MNKLILPLTLTLLVSSIGISGTAKTTSNSADSGATLVRATALVVITAPAGKYDEGGDYYETCSGVGLTTWDTCRAAGGTKTECEAAAQESQNNCMRDFGCPPIIF